MKLKTTHRLQWQLRAASSFPFFFFFIFFLSVGSFHATRSIKMEASIESRLRILKQQRTLPRVSIQLDGYIGAVKTILSFFLFFFFHATFFSSPSPLCTHKTVNSFVSRVVCAFRVSQPFSLLFSPGKKMATSPFPFSVANIMNIDKPPLLRSLFFTPFSLSLLAALEGASYRRAETNRMRRKGGSSRYPASLRDTEPTIALGTMHPFYPPFSFRPSSLPFLSLSFNPCVFRSRRPDFTLHPPPTRRNRVASEIY